MSLSLIISNYQQTFKLSTNFQIINKQFSPTVDGFLEAEDAVQLFLLSKLDEDEQLSKVWSRAKEEGDHTRPDALTKREFMTAIKYIALAQVSCLRCSLALV